MMDIAYVVKGFISVDDKEKVILYVGVNPERAFKYLEWGDRAEVVVEIWQDGHLIREVK